MKLEYLSEFCAVARSMNLSKTANELRITQSCLSKHMVAIEQETGLKLIEHRGNSLVLTEVGGMFLQESALLLSGYQDMLMRCQAKQADSKNQERPVLYIQELLQNNATLIVYKLVDAMQAKGEPAVSPSFVLVKDDSPVNMMESKALDIGICMRFMKQEELIEDLTQQGFYAVPLLSESVELWYYSQSGFQGRHGAAETCSITLKELSKYPITITTGGCYDYMEEALTDLFARNRLMPRFKYYYTRRNSVLPDEYRASDSPDSVLFTTPAFTSDMRLRSRDDLSHTTLTDPDLQLSFALYALSSNEVACQFIEYAKDQIPSVIKGFEWAR